MKKLRNSGTLILRHVKTVGEDGTLSPVHVVVDNGMTVKISEDLPPELPKNAFVMDGEGMLLLPAGVDPQVHLRVPGQPDKETAETGLKASLAGGIGALLTMPNTKPVIDSLDALEQGRAEMAPAIENTGVHVLWSAAMTRGQRGKEPVDFHALAKAGVAAFTDDGVGVMSDDLMRLAFAASCETGLPILQHAENVGHGGVLAPGPVQKRLGVAPYPSAAETDMVMRDLRLLENYPDARYHVLHVSSGETLAAVRAAKDKGLNVTCEVSPHHLYFTCEDIDESFSSFKMNPPLRSPSDRAALRAALRDGTCDFVATDHAPHEATVKTTNFKTAAYGTTGLETSLRVLLTLVKQGELSLQRLIEVFSRNPAAFLHLHGRFGFIREGFPFNAVLVDPLREIEVNEAQLASLSTNNCFIGSRLNGEISAVFLETHHTVLERV